MNATPQETDEFDIVFNGLLYSLLSWQQLNTFWAKVDTRAGWYLYAVGEERPIHAADSEHVAAFIREIDALLRKEHHEDYCGIVYADNLTNPKLIKIYDPNHLGSSCGSSKTRILPGWIMSQIPPRDLTPTHSIPQNRKRWWQGFHQLMGGDK